MCVMPEENLVNDIFIPSSPARDQFFDTQPAHFLLLNCETTSKFKLSSSQLKEA